MIAIVDYGAGNLTSVSNAFQYLGVQAELTRDPAVIGDAERVVFPGVGAAKSAMMNLEKMKLISPIKAAAASGRPFLGICLGMQILFDHSEEDGGVDTLGIFRGSVRRFPSIEGVKVPEIGWNQVNLLGDGSAKEYYFVHSYYADLCEDTVGVSEYAGVEFTAMVRRGRLWACQFHPEKSGRIGLELIKEWLAC